MHKKINQIYPYYLTIPKIFIRDNVYPFMKHFLGIRKSKTATKAILLIAFGLVFINLASAQKNLVPGFIIKLDGDTTYGYINDRNWTRNPSQLAFKPNKTAQTINLTPLAIKGFGTSEDLYESGIIAIERNPSASSGINSEDAHFNLKSDTVFLNVLVDGKKSLYRYRDKNGNNFFFIKRDSLIEYLRYKHYRVQRNGKTFIATNQEYLTQLASYLHACPYDSLQLIRKNVRYDEQSLIKLFTAYYHTCADSETHSISKQRKIADFGVLAGMTLTSINFSGSHGNSYLIDAPFGYSLNGSAGIFLDLLMSRSFKKWSIYNELNVNAYRLNASYRGLNDVDYQSDLGHTYIKLTNMIRFRQALSRNALLFFNGGITNGVAIHEVNTLKLQYTTEPLRERKALDGTRRYEQGLAIGLGGAYKRISLQLRSERSTGPSAYTNLKSTLTRHYMLIGYTL